MEFSRQEYWSGLPFPSPGDLPNPGIELMSPALEADSLLSEPPGKPKLSSVFSPQLFGKLSQRNCTCAPKLLSWTGGSDGKKKKKSACNAEDPDLIPGSGRSPGGENGNPLQCSCLENPMDRGAWQSMAQGVTKSWTQLSN